MTQDENRIVGYLLKHPNAQETSMCIDLNLHIKVLYPILVSLQKRGVIDNRGYASHVQEWYVCDGGKFLSNENVGKLYGESR